MLSLYVTSPQHKNGKSFVSAGLAATMQSLGYSTCVYKPIQTSGIEHGGFTQSPDLTYVKTIDPYINTHFTYLFKSNHEPLIAAEIENNPIEIELIRNEYKKISSSYDCTIIDGDNGIMSPISQNLYNLNIIKQLKLPVLIIIEPDEDCINNVLLNINCMQQNEINIRGVIINNIKTDCNKILLTSISRIVEEYTNTKILGLIENLGKNISPDNLISAILNGIDIESVFNVKIEKLEL